MAKACCDCSEHKQNTQAMLVRSGALLTLGLLDFIPGITNFLCQTNIAWTYFVLATYVLSQSLRYDFAARSTHCMTYLVTLGTALYITTLTPTLISTAILTSLIGIAGLQLLAKQPFPTLLTNVISRLIPGNKKAYNNPLHFPAVDGVILLWTTLIWEISLAHMLNPAANVFTYMLPDALLLLGTYNIASWIKRSMQSHIMYSNNHKKITIVDNNDKPKTIQLAMLKKGMRIRIDNTLLLPVQCKSSNCEITDDAAEQRKHIRSQKILPANTTYHSGIVIANEDYQPLTYQESTTNHNDDPRLTTILSATLTVSLATAVKCALRTHNILQGMHTFCMNLIVSCPCVFIVTKPILYNKFLSWLKKFTPIEFNKMSYCAKPNIIVLDRTNTTYLPDEKNPDGPYQLAKGAIKWIKELSENQVTCYILSGHNTGKWQKNHQRCCEELGAYIPPQHILFNKTYHNDLNAKAEVIKQLQKYGQLQKPTTLFERCKHWLYSLFGNYSVAMIGDGNNDVKAMQQADLAICVTKDKNNANTQALKSAHFTTTPSNLTYLPVFMSTLGHTNNLMTVFMLTAAIVNTAMLGLVNGWITLAGSALTPSVACLFVSISCIALTFLASISQINSRKQTSTQIPLPQKNHACCSPSLKKDTVTAKNYEMSKSHRCIPNKGCVVS